jgi:hypothetical protein
VRPRLSERRNADAGKPESFLSAQGTYFRGHRERSHAPSPVRGRAPHHSREASPSRAALKKVTFDDAIGAAKHVDPEEPPSIMIYSHCMGKCCWESSEPETNIDAYLHIDCRFADGAAMAEQPHDGRHASVQSIMLKATGEDGSNWAEICWRVKRHLRKGGKSLLIGLWSSDGMHGCVAVAELLFAILSYEALPGVQLHLEHTALDNHAPRAHRTGCGECNAAVAVSNYKAAKSVWDAASDARM